MQKIMEKVVVNENQRGLLFKNGKFINVLDPGKYYVWGGREIVHQSVYGEILCPKAGVDSLLASIDFASRVLVIDVEDHQLALVYRNGNFVTALPTGRHAYWNEDRVYTMRIVDRTVPEVPEDLPVSVLQRLTIHHKVCKMEEVTEYQKGLLFVNRQFVRMLEPGVYYFWNCGVPVQVRTVDTRLLQLDVNGQEMLTRDKVTIRVNLVCHYRIREYDRILLEVDDYEEQLHLAAQMALREYVGRCGLDEILENKDKMRAYLLERLREKEGVLYLTVTDAGVKDIILPGEIREIMNTVLVAEKRAQANVITRREEVA
ncbi:MAG: slipin family protein, partial [Clostridia bacterium]|nr:slipin family protein [Clostridia bacterium]